jgi:hypothetical protein
MGKLITTLQHSDPTIIRIQDGVAQVVNPLLKAWYGKFGIPGDCAASIIEKRVTLADDWIAPTLLNGWVNYGGVYEPAGYTKKNGFGFIRGLVKDGTPGWTTPIFTLPSTHYPQGIVSTTQVGDTPPDRVDLYDLGVGTYSVCAETGASTVFLTIRIWYQCADPSPVPNSIFPLTFPHGLTPGKIVTTVLLADAIDTVSLAHVSSSCSWETYGADQVRIIDLPGLHALRTYDLTFLVLGG